MFDFLTIVKAMADENRLRILMALRGKELCVCTIAELLNLAPSTTSKHLSILRQARLIESVKDGRFVYYRLPLPESRASAMAGPGLAWLGECLKDSQQVVSDDNYMREIIAKSEPASADALAASAEHRLYRHVHAMHDLEKRG